MRFVRLGLFGLSVLVMGACSDIDTSRQLPARGSVGEEVFGIFCDRVAGQVLREDLTGASFHAVCHKVDGQYADTVDESLLPPPTSDAVDQQGNPVPIEKQQADRAYALSRIGALTRRRQDLIAAIDAVVPDVKVPVKDVSNPDPTRSCDAPAASGEDSLPHALADMLSRFATLYDDGTLPHSTESLGELMDSIQASPDAQAAFARIGARLGYRPVATALGAARPAMAYPHLRDLANATLRVLSDHSDAYDPSSPPAPPTRSSTRRSPCSSRSCAPPRRAPRPRRSSSRPTRWPAAACSPGRAPRWRRCRT